MNQEVGYCVDLPVVMARAGYQVYARVVLIAADEGQYMKLTVNARSANFTKSHWEVVYEDEIPRVADEITKKFGAAVRKAAEEA